MKPKILYVSYIISTFCKYNCSYCTLSKEERQETDFLDLNFIKFSLPQLVRFYKKYNYKQIIISITGDELHAIPNFLEYFREISEILKNNLSTIPRENIKIKCHTNLRGEDSFYIEQINILEYINKFSIAEFETVYQAMYHNKDSLKKFFLIKELTKNIKFVSSLAILQEQDKEKCSQLKVDYYVNFGSNIDYELFSDREVNYIIVDKNRTVVNGCGYIMNKHLLNITDKNFCSDCTNKTCLFMKDVNRI
jgi:organic radical activating enzyme